MGAIRRNGDDGRSQLLFGRQLRKTSRRFEAIGDVDELNCFIGLARAKNRSRVTKSLLLQCQQELFVVGSELACLPRDAARLASSVDARMITNIEAQIERYQAQSRRQLHDFVVPGGSEASVLLDVCRAVCRRAERHVAHLVDDGKAGKNVQIYLNRLSSLLFLLARLRDKTR